MKMNKLLQELEAKEQAAQDQDQDLPEEDIKEESSEEHSHQRQSRGIDEEYYTGDPRQMQQAHREEGDETPASIKKLKHRFENVARTENEDATLKTDNSFAVSEELIHKRSPNEANITPNTKSLLHKMTGKFNEITPSPTITGKSPLSGFLKKQVSMKVKEVIAGEIEKELIPELNQEQAKDDQHDNAAPSQETSSSESDINLPDDKEEVDEMLAVRDQQQEGTLFSLIFMVLFIVHFILEVKMEPATGIISILNKSIYSKLTQNAYFRGSLMNVTNEDELETNLLIMASNLFTDYEYNYTTIEKLNIYNNSGQDTDDSVLEEENASNGTRLLQANNDSSSQQGNDTKSNNAPLYGIMIKKYTYFMGMRITTNNAKMSTNNNPDTMDVIPEIRQQVFSKPTDAISSSYVNQTLNGYNYSSSGGYQGRGGFVQYFKGNTSLTQVFITLLDMMYSGWFRNNMVETIVEAMYYNKNTQLGIIVTTKFFKSNSGHFTVTKETQVFLPQNYAELTASLSILKFCLFIGSSIGVLTLVIKIIVQLIMKAKQFFVQGQLNIEWFTYIDITVVCLCLASIVIWFKLFVRTQGVFQLPLKDENDFQLWIDVADEFRTYLRVSAMCVVLMCIRNLRVLTTQFPAFGVLFDTIRKAKTDLVFFFIFAFILALAAVCLAMGFFGQFEQRFTTMMDTIMTLFQMMFGKFFYQEMEDANKTLAPIFFYPFIIAFFYIVLSFFSAMIMRTYDNLRQKKQLVTEAMAMILTSETKKQKAIWLNLLCCRIKQPRSNEEDENEFYQSESSTDSEDEKSSHKHKKSHKKKQSNNELQGLNDFLKDDDGSVDRSAQDPSLQAKILFNLNQIKNLVRGSKFKTREQFEAQLHRAKVQILRRKQKEIKQRRLVFTAVSSRENYLKLKESLVYLVYIVIFVVMILYQTNNTSSQKAGWPVKRVLKTQPFTQYLAYLKQEGDTSFDVVNNITFDQIEDANDMMDFVTQNIYPFIYESSTLAQVANVAVGQYYMRMTLRFVNNSVNNDTKTNSIFMGKHNTYALGSAFKNEDYFEIIDPTIMIDSMQLNYTASGDQQTSFDGKGGYVIYISSNETEAAEVFDRIYPIDWLYYGLAMFSIDFVIFNPNYQKYVYNKVVFEIDGAGFVTPSTGSSSLYLNHFVPKNWFIIIIELLYVFFNIFYFVKISQSLLRIWRKLSRHEATLEVPPRAGRFVRVILYIGIDYQKFERKSIIIIVFRIVLGIVIFIVKTALKIWRTLFKQVTRSAFTAIDFVQLVLSTQIIFVWIFIIAVPPYTLLENETEPNVIPSANQLANYQEYYRTLCHFNAFITFLRILQFFTFSKKLSAFSEVISSAKYDILFFVLMFAFIIFGYSVAGSALYGGSIPEFRTIFLASLQLLRTLLLDFNYSRMYETDSRISAVFFVTYVVIFKIALLNMFIAIIVAHYNQFRRESDDDDNISFFQVIANILKNNLCNKDNAPTKPPEKRSVSKCKCCDIKGLGEFLFGNPQLQGKKEEAQQEHQKEKENVQAILKDRVSKPVFTDYRIHYGMKSYFLEDLAPQPLAVRNADIYKRAEQQGFHPNDFNSAHYWLYHLEENLRKQTNAKVSLYDFHSDENIFSDILEQLDPEGLNRFQQDFLMIAKDDQARLEYFNSKAQRVYQKYDLWKAMDFEKQIKVVTKVDEDLGSQIIKYLYGMNQDNRQQQLQHIQHKLLLKSAIFGHKFNRVTKMQHYIWTQVLTTEEQYMLWFEIFNSQERVRMWNTLVFSENYFNYVGYSSKWKRADIRQLMTNIKQEVQADIEKKEKRLQSRIDQQERFGNKRRSKFQSTLSEQEKQRIRDKHYTAKTMLGIWEVLKKRRFEIAPKTENGLAKYHTLSREEFNQMMASMFKIMVCGISGDILKTVQKMSTDKSAHSSKVDIFKKLKLEMFDWSEYRLSLWLPLSLREKLDMLLHERIEEEMEMMIFLLEQEYDLSGNIGNSDRIDLILERSLDAQIFQKYKQLSRYQAIKKSLELCQKRMIEVFEEDKGLLQYAAFMREKADEYDSAITQLSAEVARSHKKNQKMTAQLEEEQKQYKQAKKAYDYRRQTLMRGGAMGSLADDDEYMENERDLIRQSSVSRHIRRAMSISKCARKSRGSKLSLSEKREDNQKSESTDSLAEMESNIDDEEEEHGYDAPNETQSPSKFDRQILKK